MIIRRATPQDVSEIRKIMIGFGLPKKVFITSSEERIEYLIRNHLCIICEEDNKIIGFILTEGSSYIDTICSNQAGVGKIILDSLPTGVYEVNISKLNDRSQSLFKKAGFEYMYDEVVEGERRGRYRGIIKQKRSFE